MITTLDIKANRDNVFEIGNGDVNILILGSCRCVAYVNYLDRYNRSAGEPFRIFVIEPNDWSWDTNGNPVDRDAAIQALETNGRILRVIRQTDFFIHEYYQSYGMFNTFAEDIKCEECGGSRVVAWDIDPLEDGAIQCGKCQGSGKTVSKNIYQFNMRPNKDITIPNFHDRFILEHDYTACGIPTPDDYIAKGEVAVEEFCNVCMKSSFPEFAEIFRLNWRDRRYFWRPNHTSALFTLDIFGLMNSKFLNLKLTDEFWNGARSEDLFREPHTEPTQRDIEGYGLKWS